MAAGADRGRVSARLGALFERVDLLLTPISAGPPVRVGETTCVHRGERIEFRTLVMGTTMPQNLAGLPSCTVRAGFDGAGVPVGIQFTGPPGSDSRTVAAAEGFFGATAPIQHRVPEIAPRNPAWVFPQG
jgi:Asp-tRNA(Asn)/Glu-tRNA(Gln) amidotransferase A subunit family amidase